MRIMVVGDVMIDRYIYVNSSRIAPEAPIPVWDIVKQEDRPGGAANVAMNIISLMDDEQRRASSVYLCGLTGTDLRNNDITKYILNVNQTMLKTRYVDINTNKYLLRCDNIKKFSEEYARQLEMALTRDSGILPFDVVVFSDYDKGTITQPIVEFFKNKAKKIIVDSKRRDLSMYNRCNVLKVNEHEYSNQVSDLEKPYTWIEELFDYCVVTKGALGAELRQAESKWSGRDRREFMGRNKIITHSEQIPTESVESVDVTGCGDTHTAAMAYYLSNSDDVRMAVRFANKCAAVVVKKFGTSTLSGTHIDKKDV